MNELHLLIDIIIATYIPHFTESAPQWVYLTAAALVFLYLMLDAMDGTQARRYLQIESVREERKWKYKH